MGETIKILFGLGCVFLVGFFISIYSQTVRLSKLKQDIINNYGKEIDIKEINYKMDSVSSYFRNKNEQSDMTIDDITWNDLSMDNIFKKINNTQSTAGREVLYDILRNPIKDSDKLKQRDNLIDYFRKNSEERFKVQYILARLGESGELYTSNCLFNQIDDSKSKLLKYRLLSKLLLVGILLMFLSKYFILITIVSICLNVYISQANKNKNYNTEGFNYVIGIINTANKIKSLNIKEIDNNLDKIDNDLNCVKKLRKNQVGTDPNSMVSELNVFSEYFNMIFLSELIKYEKVKNTIIKNQDHIKNIYEFVGSIDALIGVASFRDSLEYICKPNLSQSINIDEKKLDFIDIYHPLIKKPVENSGEFDKSVIITGSNASGKSTFIKTIAINAVMSQSIFTCCAKEYSSSYFKIYTSMALKDDILSKESYYIVEIKSLKRILDSVNDDIPCLCFVDEILRGTNTIERISSSCEVLGYLGGSNCICFAATHDIELTHLLEDKFDNYHFKEYITDNDIKFDYKLHKGRAKSRNAIKLLGFMGYNKDIVDRAEKRAENFLEKGKWEN